MHITVKSMQVLVREPACFSRCRTFLRATDGVQVASHGGDAGSAGT